MEFLITPQQMRIVMNKMCLSPSFHRFGKVVILITFFVSGCACSPSEVRYDDTTRKYSIGRDGTAIHSPSQTGKKYSIGNDDDVTANYTLGKDEKAKIYTHQQSGETYTVDKNDGVTAYYILKEGPPPAKDMKSSAPHREGMDGAVPDSAEAFSSPIIIEASDILFEFDKAVIKKEYYPILDEWVEYFRLNPRITAEIHGHTDSTGPAAYNQKLSERRAASVMNYLVDNGIGQDRLTARGFGERMPVAPNTTPEGRQKNRRVEMKF